MLLCPCNCVKSPEETGRNVPGRRLRWLIYCIGVLEAFIFAGSIFGWAQLVYILKNEGVFSNLCSPVNTTTLSPLVPPTNESDLSDLLQDDYAGCTEQDQTYALIYAIACIVYSAPASLMGLLLHHCGLVVSRILAALMNMGGFVALAYTTKEQPHWLYVSIILLAVGGNLLRMSGLQFCNLFPNYRSTALTIITGSFSASAGLFIFFYTGQKAGFSLWSMSMLMAGIAFVSLPATLIMPCKEIYDYSSDDEDNLVESTVPPLKDSLFSWSAFLHLFWLFVNISWIKFYAMNFNSWITKFSESNDEAGYYSMFLSLSSFVCPLVSPFPGLLTDYIYKKGDLALNSIDRAKIQLRSPLPCLVTVTMVSIGLMVCQLFNNALAVYTSIVAVIILRASILAVGNSFLRIRFPSEHFNRIVGIHGTIVSIFTGIIYLYFIWTQNSLLIASIFAICLMILTMLHPLHLLSNSYFNRIAITLLRKNYIRSTVTARG